MSDFGELRAWLANPARTGAALDRIMTGWEDGAQLCEEVLPYLSVQIRRQDIRLGPHDGVLYADWFDAWLRDVHASEDQGAWDEAAWRVEDCLRLMPACIPARVNHHRLVHRGAAVRTWLEYSDWEAHGPYGDESWEVVCKTLLHIEEVGPWSVEQMLDVMWDHIEHQSTLYPSTIAAVIVVQSVLDRHIAQAEYRDPILAWLTAVMLHLLDNIFDIFSSDEHARRSSALLALPSCMTLEFRRTSQTKEIAQWCAHRRQTVWQQNEDFSGYADYEVCRIPVFPDEVFVRDTGSKAPQHMIYGGLYGVLYQVLAAGIPLYRRAQEAHLGSADVLLLCSGHLASADQDEIIARRGEQGIRALF